MDITPKKRASIIALRKKHADFSIRRISEKLKVSKSTVGDILKRYEDTGEHSTLRQGRCGRKPKTTPRDDTFLIRNSVKDPKKTSKDLQRDLSAAGVNVSSSTVRRRLSKAGRFARKPDPDEGKESQQPAKIAANTVNKKNSSVIETDRVLCLIEEMVSLRQGDKFNVIGKNVASRLKKIPSNMRIVAEKLIGDILFQAPLGVLNVHSKIS